MSKWYCPQCGVSDSPSVFRWISGSETFCSKECANLADATTQELISSTRPAPVPTPAAQKADKDKLPLDLLDPAALEGIAAVLAFGAKKYAPHNWRQGFKWSRLVAAMLRHTFAIMRGEYTDPESGLPHIDHVGCCWMFLSNHMKTKPELNDLWREPETVGRSDATTNSPTSAS